jgi:hypothetical protein
MRVTRLAAPVATAVVLLGAATVAPALATDSTTVVQGLDELPSDLGFGLRYASFTMLGQRFLETPDAIGEPVEVTVG